MKSNIIHPDIVGTDGDQMIGEEKGTLPAMPERKHKHSVDTRLGFIAAALMASSILFAQDDMPKTPPATPQTPTTVPAHQQPYTQQHQGWTKFDNNVGTRLKLQDDQMKRLQEVDGRYKERYTGLGEMPWTNAGYAPLTDQRNNDIKGILTPQQYDQWTRTYSGQGPDKAPSKPAGMTGTTTPPTGKP